MLHNIRLSLVITCLMAFASFAVGCASGPVVIAPEPPPSYEILGPAFGEATGSIGLISQYTFFIPLGLNSRVERAYEQAVASVPGATGLIDVTLQENWLYWLFGVARSVTITGQAIREVPQ